jgi:hypothetical protein
MCFADSLFMSLHSTPSDGRQLKRSQVGSLLIPERTTLDCRVSIIDWKICAGFSRDSARNLGS